MKIGLRQKQFAKEYLIDLNATQAAIRAGYSEKTAPEQGSRLLRNVNVWVLIQREMIRRAKRTEITQDRVLKELAMIAFSDLQHYIEIEENTGAIRAKSFEEMPEGESRALKSIKEDRVIKEDADGKKTTVYDKVRFELHDKLKALELIGRHLGMFTEKIEHSGEIKHAVFKMPRPKKVKK